jgi:ATP-dependent DNA helicase RecQ
MSLEVTLATSFGLERFRPGQRQVIEAVLAGQPTVAVMPTGAGKSLCYQLPAVALGGTTIVVSPLIALMKDQVDVLTARGIPAVAITSQLGAEQVRAALAELAAGRLRLCYVAPERFKSPRFADALAELGDRLSLFAVDEAHCISEWGHDFRPDYMRLGQAVARLRPPRLLALTATATPEVRKDIARQLGMRQPAIFVRGFDRPNLRFHVETARGADDKLQRVRRWLRGRPGGSALVYTATRKNAEALADGLGKGKDRVAVYHAGLKPETRAEVQDRFMSGKVDVVVATNAFGMGVDKADVRVVIHADLPRSPEAYYQEAGRGGRDGDAADCVLLFSFADVRLQEFLIQTSCPSLEVLRALWKLLRDDPRRGASLEGLGKRLPGSPSDAAVQAAARYLARAGHLRDDQGVWTALRPGEDPEALPTTPIDPAALEQRLTVEQSKLRSMIGYAEGQTCRRKTLLAYFGDEDARTIGSCGACDACLGTGREVPDGDDAVLVGAALRLVAELKGRFGRTRVAGLLAGSDDDDRLLELPGRGALRSRGLKYGLDLLRALEGGGLIVASPGEYPTLAITSRGKAVIGGKEQVPLAMPSVQTSRKRSSKSAAFFRRRS